MRIAVSKLKKKPEKLLIDGRDKFTFEIDSTDIVRGDETESAISAASIIAKVTRDDLMIEMGKKFPSFGFAENAGYGTKAHCDLLEKEIYCPEHRKSYDPLKTWLVQGRLF
jgi:ribonuclease HII